MLTSAQVETYRMLEDQSDRDLLPPRQIKESVDGHVLLIGRSLDADDFLADCPCGHEHVNYYVIRSDGFSSQMITSGTFGEMFDVPESLIWDIAVPVEPADWPATKVVE